MNIIAITATQTAKPRLVHHRAGAAKCLALMRAPRSAGGYDRFEVTAYGEHAARLSQAPAGERLVIQGRLDTGIQAADGVWIRPLGLLDRVIDPFGECPSNETKRTKRSPHV